MNGIFSTGAVRRQNMGHQNRIVRAVWLVLLSAFIFGMVQGCTQTPHEQSSAEWGVCLATDPNSGFSLDRAQFPPVDVGRVKEGDVIRFTAVGDSYSAWQAVTRLAESAGESWRFISDHGEADVLFISLDGPHLRLTGEIDESLRAFGVGDEKRLQIIARALTVEPNAILYFGNEERLGASQHYRKIIMTREKSKNTNRVGMHTVAAVAAIGGPKDFEALLSCRGKLVPPHVSLPRPTDEGRALFAAMLRL